VVNNAASPLVFGEATWLTRQMVRRQFDVNVIGAWAVSQTFLPHLIQSKGRSTPR
jgi:NAD(P)-dependent dehydrogenase (short-subunit alcohol dehydrogenase family)